MLREKKESLGERAGVRGRGPRGDHILSQMGIFLKKVSYFKETKVMNKNKLVHLGAGQKLGVVACP